MFNFPAYISPRPKTAGAVQDNNKRLTLAMYKMSPDMASLIKDALGPHAQGMDAPPGSGSQQQQQRAGDMGKPKVVDIPNNPTKDLTAIQERLEGIKRLTFLFNPFSPGGALRLLLQLKYTLIGQLLLDKVAGPCQRP